jgi:hypothetical protein
MPPCFEEFILLHPIHVWKIMNVEQTSAFHRALRNHKHHVDAGQDCEVTAKRSIAVKPCNYTF